MNLLNNPAFLKILSKNKIHLITDESKRLYQTSDELTLFCKKHDLELKLSNHREITHIIARDDEKLFLLLMNG